MESWLWFALTTYAVVLTTISIMRSRDSRETIWQLKSQLENKTADCESAKQQWERTAANRDELRYQVERLKKSLRALTE